MSLSSSSASAVPMEEDGGPAPLQAAAEERAQLTLESPLRTTHIALRRAITLHFASLMLCCGCGWGGCAVLSAVKVSRLSNGLRHDDHLRYRRYCSRRIARLRATLGWMAGPKAAVRPRPLPSPLPSPLFLSLLLTEAERSWSFAQQLAGERSEEAPRKRFHQLKRLKRAVLHSTRLDEACQQVADARTQLQAEAYRADMSGSYAFERGDFALALQHFLHAKAVYTQLGQVGGSDLAALCEERLAHQRDSIRMSRYFQRQQKRATGEGGAGRGRGGQQGEEVGEDGDDDDVDVDGDGVGGVESALSSTSSSLLSSKLQLLVKERERAAAASLDTVEWMGRTVPVSNEKARLVLVRLQTLRDEVERRKRSVGRQRAAAEEGVADASGSGADRGVAAGVGEAGEEEGDGQRSVTGLYQQMANALDDLHRIAKEDQNDTVHIPHLTTAQYSTAHRSTLSRRWRTPPHSLTLPSMLICCASLPLSAACGRRSWKFTVNSSSPCSRTRRSSQPTTAHTACQCSSLRSLLHLLYLLTPSVLLLLCADAAACCCARKLRCLSLRHSLLAASLRSAYLAAPTSLASTPASTAPSVMSTAAKAPRIRAVKADEVVLLYEKLMANLTDLLALCTREVQMQPGAGASPAAAMAAALRLELAVAEAQRTLVIAESYARAGASTAALALLHLLLQRCQQAKQLPDAPLKADAQLLAEHRTAVMELHQVERAARAQQLIVHAKAVLQQQVAAASASAHAATALAGLSLREGQSAQAASGSSTSQSASSSSFASAAGPLLSRVDDFSVGPPSALWGLTEWPPAYAAVPCKPVLFDLAFNAVQHHPGGGRGQAEEEVEEKSTSRVSGPAPAGGQQMEEGEEEESEQRQQQPTSAEPSKGGGLLGAVGGAVGGLGKWVRWRR